MTETAITIRIQPETNGWRWYLRTDYSLSERSGWCATWQEALVAVAAEVPNEIITKGAQYA